ncbi:MAG: YeeE/YedE family protein [Scytonematopsis contorta HA4267-MV1]|jgi:hypothetical protein|nr:YeeE/YedE family protein [Scytonematopsis contorta HA4267-MV1]
MSSSVDNTLPSQERVLRPRSQKSIVAITLALITCGTIALSNFGWRQSVLFLISVLLGMSLFNYRFGFASAYRKLIVNRDVSFIYAQLIMLGIATILFAPVLANGSIFGQEVKGTIAPVGLQGAIGAFLFGVGMQLGGACGCGTLYTIGSGSISMLLTLIAFCLGSFWASVTRQIWKDLPTTEPIVFGQTLGWLGAVFLQLALFVLLANILWRWSKTKRQEERLPHPPYLPLPLIKAAIALAVLNWLTLIISGQPWRITWGFVLWAAKIATFLGWDLSDSPFWSSKVQQTALSESVFADVTSVMNIGIILGALLAAAFAGRLIFQTQIPLMTAAANLLGGLVMGYGALLAFGCNVSAFFGGIASTSLHGWVWIICALLGTLLGVRLRSVFKLQK